MRLWVRVEIVVVVQQLEMMETARER